MARRRVLLIDDHPVVMEGVRNLLLNAGGFDIIGECQVAADGVAAAGLHQPDLIVLDMRIGDTLAPDVCDALRAAAPQARIVVFTAFDDEALLLACQRKGVQGILLKDTYGVDLIKALREVADGKSVLDARIDSARIERGAKWSGQSEGFERLTEREHQILRLLSRGMTSREIAAELALATNTVRSYTQEVLAKLQATNRVQAIATGRRLRLI